MKARILTIIFTLLIWISNCYGGLFTAKLVCKETDKPIEYANVGIVGKNVGTTTDAYGSFTLELADEYSNDDLRISSIGFKPMTIKVRDLKQQYPAGSTIYINEQHNELKEVVVKPRKWKHARLGNTTNAKMITIGFDSTLYGHEVGVLMHPARVPAYIDSVRINVAWCEFDTVFLRLNIYEQNDTDFINVLTEPIYITMPGWQAERDHIKLDLTKYHISVSKNFLVSVEYVKDMGEKRMHFSCALLTRNCYVRNTSQADWYYFPKAGPGISAYITY